jgi:hypothetical protein
MTMLYVQWLNLRSDTFKFDCRWPGDSYGGSITRVPGKLNLPFPGLPVSSTRGADYAAKVLSVTESSLILSAP